MTAEQVSAVVPVTAGAVERALTGFLAGRVDAPVELEPDQDLFVSGLVSSMFAMQLVVHLEESYGIAIVGPELKLDNFRSVRAMARLVMRLREGPGEASDG
jgi:methoxymalonate biosynthesis acyl carrier protein